MSTNSKDARTAVSDKKDLRVWFPSLSEDETLSEFGRALAENPALAFHPVRSMTIKPTNVIHLAQTMFRLAKRARSKDLSIVTTLAPLHRTFVLKDGGSVCCLDFVSKDPAAPVLVLCPTFCGGMDVIERVAEFAYDRLKWTVVVYNRRGGHCPLTSPPMYVLGNDEDFDVFLQSTHVTFPKRKALFILGYSAGGCYSARYLGKFRPSFVTGFVSVSGGFHSEMYSRVPKVVVDSMLKSFVVRPVSDKNVQNASESKREDDFWSADTVYCKKGQHVPALAIRRRLKQLRMSGSLQAFVSVERQMYEQDESKFLATFAVENWAPLLTTRSLFLNSSDDIVCGFPEQYRRVLHPDGKDVETGHNMVAGQTSHKCSILAVTKHGGHCVFDACRGLSAGSSLSWADTVSLVFFLHLLNAAK